MVFTVSLIFMTIQDFVNNKIQSAYQSKSAREFVDSSERVTPYDNYQVWTEANKLYEIFPNNGFSVLGNDLLKINLLYVYASGHPTIRNFNDLHAPYYDQGIGIVNRFLDQVFDNTSEDYQANVRKYLLAFSSFGKNKNKTEGANGTEEGPNERAIRAGAVVGKSITLGQLEPISRHAAIMVVNDYLNPNGLLSFFTTTQEIISEFNTTELNDIVNIWTQPITNRTQYLISRLGLTGGDLTVINLELVSMFEHWIFSQFSPNLDPYFVRVSEPEIYEWLNTTPTTESVIVLNEWSKVMSLAKLAEQLTPDTVIYIIINVLRDPPVPFGNSDIGADKIDQGFDALLGAATKFQGERLTDPRVTNMKNVFGNLMYS